MIARTMIAGAVVLALAAGAGPASAADAAAAKAPGKATRKERADHEGNKVSLDVDDAGKVVKAAAKNRDGKPIDIVEINVKDLWACVPQGEAKLCQPLAFLSDDAFIKMGSASCTCYVFGATLWCYGSTCK